MTPIEKREELLKQAIDIVCSDRNNQYGEPEDNFSVIGELWSAYLNARCTPPGVRVDIGAQEAADMLILFKVARSATAVNPKTDTYVDIAGYAACAGSIACKDTVDTEQTPTVTHPFKLDEACDFCKWGIRNKCSENTCTECEMCLPGIPEHCKCNDIKKGDPCPYFEYWNGKQENDNG